jgi:hypothetical protein
MTEEKSIPTDVMNLFSLQPANLRIIDKAPNFMILDVIM